MSTSIIAPSNTRRQIAVTARQDVRIVAADAAVSDAAAVLWATIVARLALTSSVSKRVAVATAIMIRGALGVFRNSHGALKAVMALIVVGMVGDLVTYPTTIWAAVDGFARAQFGMGAIEVAAVIPPEVAIGYIAALATGIFAIVGAAKTIRIVRTRH